MTLSRNLFKEKKRVCAYVLINTENGTESAISKYIQELPETIETCMIKGVFDIITKVETNTMQELNKMISVKIRQLEEVRSTLTMLVI
jgi:DNA-binding Lrp family transcriptional regulator